MKKISTIIKELMKEKEITQSELSRRTGITQSSLSDYINDKYNPKQDKIDLIAKALDVSPAIFFESLTTEEEYYLDLQTKQIAQEIFDNKELRALFDASRNATKEDLEITRDLLLNLKRKENKEVD